jgi:NifU-like protein involved in Fe-S cluster formation
MMREPNAVGEGEYEQCMDLARFYLRVRDGRVALARFQAYGCGPTLAACRVGTEVAAGAALEELAQIGEDRIGDAVGGLPAERRRAAVVAPALEAAARDAMARPDLH